MAGITHGGTLPDSSDKSDFYSLIDTATIDLTTGTAIGTSSAAAGAFTTLVATGAFTLNDDGANSVCQTIDNDGTNHGLYIKQDGVLAASKYGLYVYSNAVQVNAGLSYFHQDNASSTQDCMSLLQDGTGRGLYIVTNGVHGGGTHALQITGTAANVTADSALVKIDQDNAGSSEPALEIKNDGTGYSLQINNTNDDAVRIDNTGAESLLLCSQNTALEAAHHCGYFYSNTSHTVADTALVKITQDHASSTEPALEIKNDGTGAAAEINASNVAGNCATLTNSITTGTALIAYGSSLTTGIIANFYSDSADTGTRNLVQVVNDNAAAVNVTPLKIQQDAPTSTNFKKLITLDSLTIWISDGTTAEGALTGVEGDICLNGGTGAGQMAYCDAAGTNWTDM